MHKINSETAARMLELIRTSTYQGKVTFLLFGFMLKTDASPNEAARATFDDVYKNGQPRKAITLGEGARRRSLLVDEGLRKTIEALWLVQVHQGFVPSVQSPLFRAWSGRAFTAEELASVLWLYQSCRSLKDGCFAFARRGCR